MNQVLTTQFRRALILGACACLGLLVAPSAFAQVGLFRPAATPKSMSALQPQGPGHRYISVDAPTMRGLARGDLARLDVPDGSQYTVVTDRVDAAYGGGTVWVGHLRDYGENYLVVISSYEDQVDGTIDTPLGRVHLHGDAQHADLVDTAAASLAPFSPTADDTLAAPATRHATAAAAPQTAQAAAATTRVDLLLFYTAGTKTRLGGYSATIARINTLVATANTVYGNSGIAASLNLVSAQQYDASYTTQDDNTALNSLTSDTTVATLRSRYGADMVTLMRPFVASAGVCGLGWINDPNVAGYDAYGFSVIEDGTDGGFYCDVTTMTHELGHNMGAAHDLGTSTKYSTDPNGFPSYNRGYCNGSAGTVMAYTSTTGCNAMAPGNSYYYFSNPALTTQCAGLPCGIDKNTPYTVGSTSATGADSTTAINGNIAGVANWRPAPTKFTSLVPFRAWDTRSGGVGVTVDGLAQGAGPVASRATVQLPVVGRGTVPNSDVGAVVVNVTAVNPTAAGYATVWPTGSAQPFASNLNFVVGQTVPNLVVAKVGTSGSISIYNGSTGSTDFIADVAGWFPTSSGFQPLVPARFLDTRAGQTTVDGLFAGGGSIAGGTEKDVTIAGRPGVPTSASAVVLNVTVTNPNADGYVTVWPTGSPFPLASNLNFSAGQTIPNLVIAKLGSGGQVALLSSVRTDLIADIAGYFPASSELTALQPARLLDTRAGQATIDTQYAGGGPLAGGTEFDVTVAGRGGVPAAGSVGAVVLNVTAVSPSNPGYLTVWPKGSTQPLASNLNFSTGSIISNLVIARVGSNGQVAFFSSAGSTHLVADVVGWFAPTP